MSKDNTSFTEQNTPLNAESDAHVPTADKVARGEVVLYFTRLILLSICGAFLGALLQLSQIKMFKQQMGLNVSTLATMALITGIPAYVQPFLGAGIDLYPLFGYRRRSYLLLGDIIVCFGYLLIALMKQYTYTPFIMVLLIMGAGGMLSTVAVNATQVRIGNGTGTFGAMLSISQLIPLILGFAYTQHYAGVIAHSWSYHHCVIATLIFRLLLLPTVWMLPDKKVRAASHLPEEKQKHLEERKIQHAKTAAALKKAAKTPGLWAITAFVFYLIITPGSNNAIYYFQRDVLHLSSIQIGNLGMWSMAGTLIGLGLYTFISYFLSVRVLVWGAFLMDCLSYPILYGMHNYSSAAVITFMYAMSGILYGLFLNTLAARATPPGIEGAVYGVIMAAIALAGNLSEKFGAQLYQYFSTGHSLPYAWHHMLLIGFLFTIVAFIFIPFLPAWCRSSEPLRPKRAAASTGS